MTSGISKLGGSDDNGFCIVSRYVTYAFGDEQDRARLQLSMARVLWPYALANLVGNGAFSITVWPETLSTPSAPNPYPFTQPAFTLSNPALDDINVPLNVTANRAFIQIDSAAGADCTNWLMQRIDLGLTQDPRMWISGR